MNIYTTIDIAASREKVWSVITDFANYGIWNPVVPRIQAQAQLQADVSFDIRVAGSLALPIIACKVTECDPGRGDFGWQGPDLPLADKLVHAHHYFRIEETGVDRVRFVHREDFSGPLILPIAPLLQGRVTGLYNEWNAALKKRCELLTGDA